MLAVGYRFVGGGPSMMLETRPGEIPQGSEFRPAIWALAHASDGSPGASLRPPIVTLGGGGRRPRGHGPG